MLSNNNAINIELDKLKQIFEKIELVELFANDAHRFKNFSQDMGDLIVDYSKQRIDRNVISSLISLAKSQHLDQWIQRLFSKELINQSEKRAAMHWALRTEKKKLFSLIKENNVIDDIQVSFDKMYQLVEKIHTGQYRGVTGESIKDIVNIGVGGSDLGPLMVTHALSEFKAPTEKRLDIHFVSTIDGSQLSDLLYRLRPEETLFIISSKSFRTVDTLSNAETAKHWLAVSLGDQFSTFKNHFIGVSADQHRMTEWGIHPDNQLNLWEWVGGRYSLWSTIGFPIALLIGVDGFKRFLEGGSLVDSHFCTEPYEKNIPVLLALIEVWNSNYLNMQTHAVLPYDGRLKYFTSYLQQLEMESNGKSIKRDNTLVSYSTSPIIWGEVGPNAQHAFYQLLHQGTHAVSIDFIVPIQRYHAAKYMNDDNENPLIEQHQLALANCLAQSKLLAFGVDKTEKDDSNIEILDQMKYRGNQPSTTILIDALTPKTLGMLIAIYEHKVFVQSVIWNINPFDQWGVEKGKEIAKQIIPLVKGHKEIPSIMDSSTHGLLEYLLKRR